MTDGESYDADRREIDWMASRIAWLEAANATWAASLLNEARFLNSISLLGRFESAQATWRNRPNSNFRDVINIANEMAAAVSILSKMRAEEELEYEPPIPTTGQSIDFRIRSGDRGYASGSTAKL